MKEITISNYSFYDKDYFETYAKQEKYQFFSIDEDISTLVSLYKDLLREVIGDDVEDIFRDRELGSIQTRQIQEVFEREIEKKLPNIEPIPEAGGPVNEIIQWKEEEYPLCLSLTKPISRQVSDFYKIISICKECLLENKPMFLSIE